MPFYFLAKTYALLYEMSIGENPLTDLISPPKDGVMFSE
jgi:hypothetical protein